MAMETAERRAQQTLPAVVEQQTLPCPRCTSTNTKFCYYNNYNFSQPRHFCKSCRRYWTHGGTLRDIPIGGGSRKTVKRSPSSSVYSTVPSVTSSTSSGVEQPIPAPATTQQAPVFVSLPLSGAGGGFTSLLSGGGHGGGILTLGGFGLDDVVYGLTARGVWAFPHHDVGLYVNGGGSGGGVGPENGGGETESRSNTWQVESGELVGFVGGADCFTTTPLPELAISTSGNGLNSQVS